MKSRFPLFSKVYSFLELSSTISLEQSPAQCQIWTLVSLN